MFGIKEAISKNLYLGQEKNKPTKKTLDTFIKNVMGYKLDDSSVKYFNFCHPYYQRYIGELSELLSKSDSNEKLSFHNFYQQSYQQNQQLDSQFIIKYMIWLYKFQIQNLWNHIRQKNNIDNHVELFNDIRNNLDQINLTQPTRPDPDPFSHLSLESYAVACANYKQEKARVDS